MPTGKKIPVTKEKPIISNQKPENAGLPKGISTEAQLWDEIFKKEVLEMSFLLLPLIREVHGKSFPRDTKITPIGTEFSVERVITKDISSIRSDVSVWIHSTIFHFECEIGSHPKITKRVFEYDGQAALVYADTETGTKEVPYRLRFPYSTVLFLEPEPRISDHLACELSLPVYYSGSDLDLDSDLISDSDLSSDSDLNSVPGSDPDQSLNSYPDADPDSYSDSGFSADPDSNSNSGFNADFDSNSDSSTDPRNPEITEWKSILYAVPAIKVQNYSLQEIREKRLFILLPFTPIRFRTMLRKRKTLRASSTAYKKVTPNALDAEENTYYETAKLELTDFFHEIILILNEAVETGYICELDRKDILALLRKAMIRVFQEDKYLLEVVNYMTAPILELERETIARLQKENDAMKTENATVTSKYNAVESKYNTMESKYNTMESKYDSLKLEAEEKDALIQAQKAEIESLKANSHFFKNWRNHLKIRKHT